MRKILLFPLVTMLLAVIFLTGCSDDKSKGSAGLKAGQSAISLQLSGGHLTDTLEFSGTVDKTMMIFSDSMTFLGSGLEFIGSNGTAVFEQMILSLESSEAGTYPVKDVDIDMVFNFPAEGTGYSMQPREGTGTVTVERLNGEHVRLLFNFDASPSNIGGRDMIFHIEGVFESRPRD